MRSTASERDAISAQFRLDQNSSPSPLNLARQSNLQALLRRAQQVDHASTLEIERELARIPAPSSRNEALAADSTRMGLASSGDGNRVFVWTPDRIEAFGSEGGGPTAVYRQERGRLVWVQGDPVADGVLFEVDFEHFADPATAARVETRNGRRFLRHHEGTDLDEGEFDSEILGNEQGLFSSSLAAPDGGLPQPLGLSRVLSKLGLAANRDGNIAGYVFLARPDSNAPRRDELTERRFGREEAEVRHLLPRAHQLSAGQLRVLENPPPKVVPLVYARGGQAALYETAYSGVQRTFFMDSQLGPMHYEFIVPMVRDGSDDMIMLAEPTVYCEQAKLYQTREEFRSLGLTDERPSYLPAALDMVKRRAVGGAAPKLTQSPV